MSGEPRIALIHALEESVVPARAAFKSGWPDAEVFDLLDTSLAEDLATRGILDDEMTNRFIDLSEYAASSRGAGGATAAILFTCSAFGPAIAAVKDRLNIPVLTPSESAFEDAVRNYDKIGLLVTFEPSRRSLRRELADEAKRTKRQVSIESAVAAGALEALKRGDAEAHDAAVARAAADLGTVDALLLGQFSLARSANVLEDRFGVPVLTTPGSAVRRLKRLLGGS